MSYDQQQSGWQSGGLGDAPGRYPELGLKATVKGVKIDTKSPAAHIKERLAKAATLKAAALAGDNAAWEQLWLASGRSLPVRSPVKAAAVNGNAGWPRVKPQLAVILEEVEKGRRANQVPGGSGPAGGGGYLPPAPGTTVELPGAGPVGVPPILQPGASPTGPNAPPAGYYPTDPGAGYDAGGAPGAPTPPKLADMFGGKLGLGIAAAGVLLTVTQLLGDRKRR